MLAVKMLERGTFFLFSMLQGTALSSLELPQQYFVKPIRTLFVVLGCAVFVRGLITVILAEGEDWDTLLNKTFIRRAAKPKTDIHSRLQVSLSYHPLLQAFVYDFQPVCRMPLVIKCTPENPTEEHKSLRKPGCLM